jgi:hypothetical protein
MSDPLPAPTFSGAFDVKPMDIGSGYAAGITEAGKSIAGAIGGIADIAKQNIDTNDTLTAMKQGGILKDDEYQAVMGKSLGAKQQMLGLYAGQYIADQAERRSVALQKGQSVADIQTEHAKLLDMIQAVKSGYGTAAGVNVGKLPATPAVAAPRTPPTANPVNVTPTKLAGTPAAPTPLGSGNIYNPPAAAAVAPTAKTQLTVGPPLAGTDQIPAGARRGSVNGQPGFLMPDGITFRPLK